MRGDDNVNMFHEALLLLRRTRGEKARSLQVRLFAFFSLFAIALIGGGFLLLTVTGLFNAAERRHTTWLDTESGHLQSSVLGDFSRLSRRGVALARTIASDISLWAERNGISEDEFAARPDIIEHILSEEARELVTVLENNTCSGVFIIFDDAHNSTSSRAGLYFKRTEPNNMTAIPSKTYCLRGPASVARANKAELIGQWRAEFDVSDADFYAKALETARKNSGLDISRLYYWSARYLMEGDSEHSMRLCVPLIARNGTVYGLCGIEVNAMLFKNLYTPNGSEYPRAFTVFAPLRGGGIDTEEGLLAGNSYLTSRTNGLLSAESLGREHFRRRLDMWIGDDNAVYTGRMEKLALYPTGSPFAEETWALAVLMPLRDWENAARQSRPLSYGLFAALLLASLFAAVFISRRYIRPVVSALELIKTDNRTSVSKTRITEINDLLEYLTALDEERKLLDAEKESLAAELEEARRRSVQEEDISASAAYKQFRRNLETLTISEHAVFNLYMKNLSAQQIANKLFVSINTIKFHNRNIYSKLGISSLKELKIYVNIMKETQDN